MAVKVEAQVEVQAEVEAEVQVEVKLEAQVQAEVEAQVEVRAKVEAEVEAQVEVQVQVQAEVEAQLLVEVKVEVQAEVEAQVLVEVKVEVQAEVEVQVLVEVKVEVAGEVLVEAQVEVKVEVEVKVQVKAEVKVEVEVKGEVPVAAVEAAAAVQTAEVQRSPVPAQGSRGVRGLRRWKRDAEKGIAAAAQDGAPRVAETETAAEFPLEPRARRRPRALPQRKRIPREGDADGEGRKKNGRVEGVARRKLATGGGGKNKAAADAGDAPVRALPLPQKTVVSQTTIASPAAEEALPTLRARGRRVFRAKTKGGVAFIVDEEKAALPDGEARRLNSFQDAPLLEGLLQPLCSERFPCGEKAPCQDGPASQCRDEASRRSVLRVLDAGGLLRLATTAEIEVPAVAASPTFRDVPLAAPFG